MLAWLALGAAIELTAIWITAEVCRRGDEKAIRHYVNNSGATCPGANFLPKRAIGSKLAAGLPKPRLSGLFFMCGR